VIPAIVTEPWVDVFDSAEGRALNANIAKQFFALPSAAFVRRSHFLGGRYENLYVARETIAEVAIVLESALMRASQLLNRSSHRLRIGFWLNAMQPGDVTHAHTHDEDDELLSGVYYVTVPPHSGCLRLGTGAAVLDIEPKPGRFVFFAPDVPHEVTRNESAAVRLSVGFNVGPALPFHEKV
jgi:hypothetical protein